MTDEAVRFVNVGVRYAGRREPSLTGIDLGLARGERLGVTGRTGAGKSTLALVAGGFIPRVVRATLTGGATIEGVDATTTDPAALLGRVGIVFATPANQLSASKQTVREELAFGLENLGVKRSAMDGRIDAVMTRLGIEHLADREPFALSGGEQQRVAIASIVAMGTSVLVLDEPTAQLDPAGTAEVGDLLDELALDGTAVLVVEHDPTILGRMGRVAVLDSGRLVATEVPGRALGTAVAGSVGLPAPTLVRLAEFVSVDPARAFDEAAVVAGLRAISEGGTPSRDDSNAVAVEPAIELIGRPDRPTATVEVDDLVHRYDDGVEALRGVTLRVEPGESVAILGQNGSGKTTLVKHLNGLLRPTAGQVRIDGRPTDRDRVDQLAATVGFVFQHPDDQLFERTVEREASFGPRNLGFDPVLTSRLVDASLAAVDLVEERTTNPYDLDLSRRKLVSLASVLATDPAIVVLDEPTTGQDPIGIARVGAVIRALRDSGRTVIAITHDMEFAASHFDRVVVMRSGEIVADGPPGEVLSMSNADLLASTGLTPPPAARIAAALGVRMVPTGVDELLASLRRPE